VVDSFVDDRHYVSPPSEEVATMPILLVDRETTLRTSAKGDLQRDKLQLQAQGWIHQLARRSRYFRDPAFTDMSSSEDLRALRLGGMVLATHPLGKEARWAASASVDRDGADVTTGNRTVSGQATLVETAANLQFERATLRLDAAGGVALPFGIGADPWPEGKLVARWRPTFGPVEVVATVARKGRVPSLRERFSPGGNAALGPELASHGELRAIYDDKEHLHIEVAPFYKRTTGTVRASTDPADNGMLVNLGRLTFAGVDAQARVTLPATLEVGGSYGYIHTRDDLGNTDPLDRLPHHHADAWVQGRPHSRLTLIARTRYLGASVDKGQPVGAYTLVEATATAQLAHDYLAGLRVDDLFDKRPETRSGYFAPGRVVMLIVQGQWQ
jgi:outer membrane receptor protein involved in Fe transport